MKDLLNRVTENKKNSIIVGVFVVLVIILGFFFGRDILNNDRQAANVIESDLFNVEEVLESTESSDDSDSENDFSMTEVIDGYTYFKMVRIPVLASPELFDYDGEKTMGCGDEIVWVIEDVEATRAPLTASIEKLLSFEKNFGFEPGNFLASQDDLLLNDVLIEDRIAKIYLEGEFTVNGECDLPRQFIQLEETALQYYSVDGVQIYLNDELLR
jgi:hypothetical protein